jgi:hypothetical protein
MCDSVTYPTKVSAENRSKPVKKNGRSRSIAARRATPPEIFVKCLDREHPWRDPYARAHLRNRNGYVYLTWRDGQRVRSFYLGKAPRKCPTPELELEASAAGAGSSSRTSPRRAKIGDL